MGVGRGIVELGLPRDLAEVVAFRPVFQLVAVARKAGPSGEALELAPAGGVAMADFPAIGLDAFCQKLLVYAGDDGGSVVIFNDIAAFAELHYGSSAKPHHALNERLKATFQKALQ